MKRFVPTFSSVLSLSVALMLVALTTLAQTTPAQKAQPAAQAPAPQWLSINVIRVKPDMVTEYQDFVKKEVIPTLQKGGVKERSAFASAVFGESYEYVFVTPIESVAQYDGQSPIIKALGEEGALAYNAKVRRFIVSSRTFAVQTRPDLSYMGKMTGPPKLAVINSTHIAPGRNADFENIIKNDILPALKKADVPGYLVSQTAFGGDPFEYTSLTLADSFAEIAKGSPIIRGMGQEGFNKFLLKLAGIVVHQERTIGRFVPDLSFPAPAKTENK
jgi:hypothetical protein